MEQAETKECPVCGISNLATALVCDRCGHNFTVTDKTESRTKKLTERRIPWKAGLLSILVLGLGHVYNGRAKRGILLYSILWLLGLPGVILLVVLPTPFNLAVFIIVALIVLAFSLYVIIDSIKTARDIGDDYKLKAYNKWYIYVAVILIIWLVPPARIVRAMVVQALKNPSGSMFPTLQIGDHFLLDKLSYGIRNPIWQGYLIRYDKPERGNMVVFVYPADRSKDFLKRVIGVEGDRVEIRNKKVFINGEPIEDPHASFQDTSPGPGGVHLRDNYGPRSVPKGHIFVLGDNRDRSYDSRFWGFVPLRDVKGKAFVIYWSWDRDKGSVRWSRIGMEIK